MDGKQIYDNFKQGDTQGLRDAAQQVAELSHAFKARAEGIKGLQSRMTQAWTGDAADLANAGAGPLELAFAETSMPLDTTKGVVDAQASSFDSSSHAVVEVPDKPDKPSAWSTGLKAAIPIAGPFMAVNDVKNYQEGMAKYNAANETNVRVMDQYNVVTNGTKATLPVDYGVLQSDSAAISIKQGGGPPPIKPPIDHPVKPPIKPPTEHPPAQHPQSSTTEESTNDHTSTSQFTQTGTDDHHSTTQGPGDTGKDNTGKDTIGSPTQTGSTGKDTDSTSTTGIGSGKTSTRPPKTPTLPPGETPGDPSVIGGLPPTLGGGGGQGPYGTSTGEPGGGPGGGRGPGSAGGRLLDSSGRAGVGGSGGVGGASGAESEGRLGGGARSGMGGLGNAAAQEAAAARAAAGRGGQGGPMGAGGRRADGEEDDEHQRPDYLIEADPDAIFGTDQRTSPPVIGE